MTDDLPNIRSVSQSAPAEPPFGRAAVVLRRLELSGRGAQWLLALLTLASAVAGVPLILSLNRYLAAFGQPAPGSVSELVGFLSTIFPFFLIYVGMLAALAGFPLGTRWAVSRPSYGEHPFGDAYGWLLKNASISRWRGFRAYLVAHLPSLVVAGLAIVLSAGGNAESALIGVFFVLLATISADDLVQSRPATPRAAAKRFASNVLVACLINAVMLCWTLLLAQVAFHAASEAGLALKNAMIGGLVIVHLVMSAASYRLASILGLIAAAAAIYFAGTVPITAAALRQANLGGGNPTLYRAGEGGAPVVACEVLAIGDARILWLPEEIGERPPSLGTQEKNADELSAAGKAPCDWVAFRERARAGAKWAAAGDPAAADAVRVFSRQALYDIP